MQIARDTSLQKQVLYLRAGFDKTIIQLQEEGKALALYVELDFKEVASIKAALIESYERLRNKLGKTTSISRETGEMQSEHYKLLPVDLGDIKGLDVVLDLAQLDPSLPTSFIAECVLNYTEPDLRRMAVRWAAEKFSRSVFVIFEQIHPDDAFGQQIVRNLEGQVYPLLGLNATRSLESKQKLFTDLGWQKTVALNMDTIYNKYVDVFERLRIEQVEIFDEFEKWHIIQEHYCVAYEIIDPEGLFYNFGFCKE